MANYQQENRRRQSAMRNLLSIFHLANAPTVPLDSDEDGDGDVDEPPEKSPSLPHLDPVTVQQKPQSTYSRAALPTLHRKESLLTRALLTIPNPEASSAIPSPVPAASSRASTFSNLSMQSAAEPNSDASDTTPARSATPSPSLPATQHYPLPHDDHTPLAPSRISFVTSREQEKPVTADLDESKVEANLGRRRCISFACAGKPPAKDSSPVKQENAERAQTTRRKCMLTFACHTRPNQTTHHILELPTLRRDSASTSGSDRSAPASEHETDERQGTAQPKNVPANSRDREATEPVTLTRSIRTADRKLKVSPFHEFQTSPDHEDDWVHEPIDSNRKLTLSDCMKKENAIRKIGQEAEEEAEQEEKDDDELDDENEEGDNEDDFAPSDDGNESDNEAGFGDSGDNSDVESDEQFWEPSTTTAATSVEQVSPIRPMGSRRQSGSSMDSISDNRVQLTYRSGSVDIKSAKHLRAAKTHHCRPSTPVLPDSTDFVCGTLDEDRPLEAAYISVKEQKKREKHIPIPQDIDPSFPTTDLEDMDEEDEKDVDVAGDHLWLEDQLEGFEDDTTRGHAASRLSRQRSTVSPPRRGHSPCAKPGLCRSPPPPRQIIRRPSPAHKGRLFGHSPKCLRSPPPPTKLTSPPGTRRQSPTDMSLVAVATRGLVVSRLAQRPHMTRTSSLPRTPNPFFHNYHVKRQQDDRAAFGDATPGRDVHVRGPVDIVIGLEKKRQKRKEKYWRQHCRRAAKEQAERKTIPGRGAERMRELGLECAERTRGYGLGQQHPLVISL